MDEGDPSHGGEPQNGPAAEEETAHSEQDSSPFQTPGTVNSRRGTQSGLPDSPSTTILKDLAELEEDLKDAGTDKPATATEHSIKCSSVRDDICSMTDLGFLKLKYKTALLEIGPLPEPELDTETLDLLHKTDSDISSDDIANANLDIEHAKYLIFQLASLALKKVAEEKAALFARRQSMT
jgi:hypothetical protein